MNGIIEEKNREILALKEERDLWKDRAIAMAAHLDYEIMTGDIKKWVDEYRISRTLPPL